MFIMMSVKTKFELEIAGITTELPASLLADGCVGVALVFDTKENARKYDKDKVLMEVKEKENNGK